MYKLLLCWRYLRTRYIALASVISVTLGVATMIVVNAVMSGFAHEMKSRIHGILSDVILEAHDMKGYEDPEYHMQQIRRVAGDYIAGMTPTVHMPAIMTSEYAGKTFTRPITFIGIDETTQGEASDFCKYLLHPANRKQLSFELRQGGYDTSDREAGSPEGGRNVLRDAGWPYRRWWANVKRQTALNPSAEDADNVASRPANAEPSSETEDADDVGSADVQPATSMVEVGNALPQASLLQETDDATDVVPDDPYAPREPREVFDPAQKQHTGLVLGIALSSYRDEAGHERFLLMPGDDVRVTFPNAAIPPGAISYWFTIVDLYESKMSEYDSTFVFVPLKKLQELRGLLDEQTGITWANSVQIRLKNPEDADLVRDKLRRAFPSELYSVSTWRDKQGPLLAAVQMETAILNVLLFMIIAVAGFGILAIFFMIVVEKTRDIGILKALGASGRGVMGIFLSYGLSLGMVGSGVGMVLGLLFVLYINEIAKILSAVTGHEVFDPTIYYFYKIPTIIEPPTVAWIVCGAMVIAVLASV
ncbi:MAG TPA: FtsX-like permease family protein, partial [Pirellulales bacterium]|nr:FtsX-like permease family protein [Pirellulales bacterium]